MIKKEAMSIASEIYFNFSFIEDYRYNVITFVYTICKGGVIANTEIKNWK